MIWRRRRGRGESAGAEAANADAARAAWREATDAGEARSLVTLGVAVSHARPAPSRAFLERLDDDMWARFAEVVARACPTPREPAPRPLRPIRVMVADAHQLHRTAVMEILEADPLIEVVGEADTGDATMRLAHWLKPDVVVFDPRILDGEVVLERLRTELPRIRALVLTADESMAAAVDADGTARYVSKRTPGSALPRAVKELYAGGDDIPAKLAADVLGELSDTGGADCPWARPRLDEQELEILRRVADGLPDEAIARQLYISERMVREHLERIREGTGLSRRSELARWAAEVTRQGAC